MEEKIQKQIIDYFSFFEEFYNTAKNNLKDCQKRAITINKLIIRCKNIKEAQIEETPLAVYCGIQNRLCSKLHLQITEESQGIRTCLSSLEELFEKVCSKHRTLQESCRCVDLNDNTLLVRGSPLQPSLKKLLQYSTDSLNFASNVCAQIETALNLLSFKKLNVESFKDCFRILPDWEHRIPEIIAYTSFVSENLNI